MTIKSGTKLETIKLQHDRKYRTKSAFTQNNQNDRDCGTTTDMACEHAYVGAIEANYAM